MGISEGCSYSVAMPRLQEFVAFLDQQLNIAEIPDYPGALNGLQLENSGNVTKIGAAVDASLPVIQKAVAQGVAGHLSGVGNSRCWGLLCP